MIRCPHVLNVSFCLRLKGVLSVVTVDRDVEPMDAEANLMFGLLST